MNGNTTGAASSLRRAERSAAASALVRLGVDENPPSLEKKNETETKKTKRREKQVKGKRECKKTPPDIKAHPQVSQPADRSPEAPPLAGDPPTEKAAVRERATSRPRPKSRPDENRGESISQSPDPKPSSPPLDTPHRCGFVAVAGRPNVGKSTLLNRIAGRKFSITSRRPQTTRHRIAGILNMEHSQIVLVDTPGIHRRHRRALNRYMNKVAVGALAGVDLVLMIVEAPRWQIDDDAILERVKAAAGGTPVILLINKIDRLKRRERILPMLHDASQRHDFSEVIPISARNGENLDRLMAVVESSMPEGPPAFALDTSTDRDENFHIAEIVREKLIRRLGQELPHQLAVEIEHCRDEGRQLQIHALVWVARKQHKSIVIGSNGRCLKEVGIEARQAIAQLLDRPVHLEIWVKVRQGWPDDERALASLGYVEGR
ncbi:MAG: GTPase Era [Ectothiorhodospiraceae bacterium AqS1]|nr:GTPase Era [Ectothiorhodospiraceae bacterium AqS1]